MRTLGSVLGFTLTRGLAPEQAARAHGAVDRLLAHFPELAQQTVTVGDATLQYWGRGVQGVEVTPLPDGSMVLVAGDPFGEPLPARVAELFGRAQTPAQVRFAWDGAYVVIHIDAAGRVWTVWNDWVGAIPVFHAALGEGWIVSTLEPAVVAAGDWGAEQLFLPGVLALLIMGHLMNEWTIYAPMRLTPADSVAVWGEHGFAATPLCTVTPSTTGWETSWADLRSEMHDLIQQAIRTVLQAAPHWVLPLSAGLDSRLILAVAKAAGVEVTTYSWGSQASTDVTYARSVAAALKAPWRPIEIGVHYLADYSRLWAEMFGSSMHFHGMYQMHFLDLIRNEAPGPVLNGYLGETLAGDGVWDMTTTHATPARQLYTDGYTHWLPAEIPGLFQQPVGEALAEVEAEILRGINAVEGAWYQRLMMFEFRSRQRCFTSFSPTLIGYWRGVGIPYLNRRYAQFCFGLPRVALEGRELVMDVLRHYYRKLAEIPGTYQDEPLVLTGRYLLQRRLARAAPQALRVGPLANGNGFVPLTMDLDCVRASGWDAFWPMREAWPQLINLLHEERLTAAYTQMFTGGKGAMGQLRKLQSVEALALRLSGWQ